MIRSLCLLFNASGHGYRSAIIMIVVFSRCCVVIASSPARPATPNVADGAPSATSGVAGLRGKMGYNRNTYVILVTRMSLSN